ncbi:MAG: hypothetical protein Q9165_006480, partial [Trypethelium subeluteriae]
MDYDKPPPGSISRRNLERHGIIYHEKVYICDDRVEDQSEDSATTDAESDCVESGLPSHVNALREALLTFSDIIPEDWRELFDDESKQYSSGFDEEQGTGWNASKKRTQIDEVESVQPPAAAYFTSRRYELRWPSPQSTVAHENNERCKKIADAARKRAKEAEAAWAHFLRRRIFRDFDEENNSRTEI